MTYCVGLRLAEGLVLLSDTRTNAGVDNISRFRKLHHWSRPGERALVLLTAGNLAVTQSVVSVLNEQMAADPDSKKATLMTVPSMCVSLMVISPRSSIDREHSIVRINP